MIDNKQISLINEVLVAIDNEQFSFPVLPEVANRVRTLVNDPAVSARDVFAAISGDIAISAHLIKVANSAAYSDKPRVEHVHQAISRLGYMHVHNLVLELTLGKLLHVSNPVINQYLTSHWMRNCEVAAFSYVLAKKNPQFNADQAMLAGLLRNIGALPLCLHFEQSGISLSEAELYDLLEKLQHRLGGMLLRAWNFPEIMIAIIEGREAEGNGSYADLIKVADLLSQTSATTVDWCEVAAAKRLGMEEDFCKNFTQKFAEQLNHARNLLGIETQAEPEPPVSVTAQRRSRPQPVRKLGILASLARLFGFEP